MRPLELRLRGFRSYRDEATFDWRGRGLVGVVGPIGAGKSSLLDAVAFALYGKTPAVEGATKSLIHQLCAESHVELRFEVDGQVWRAVRSLRRKGASGHRLERLASDDPDAMVVDFVDGDEPMKARVEQLLGMDFKAFCRSVLLAQNRFSDFLKATPGQRDDVLKGVFGYERLDEAQRVARLRLQQVELEVASLGKERRSVDDARAQLEEARTVAASAHARLRALEAAAPEVERLAKEQEAAAADARDARTRIAALNDLAAALPSQTDVERAATRGTQAAEVRGGGDGGSGGGRGRARPGAGRACRRRVAAGRPRAVPILRVAPGDPRSTGGRGPAVRGGFRRARRRRSRRRGPAWSG